ncbi:MAG: helix-turn-helix domain-containing protein [Pyrinomonadaceae bacterium]
MSSNLRITRICEFCGESFTARTTVTKYCSHRCSSGSYKQRERSRNVKKSVSETVKRITKDTTQLKAQEFLSVEETAELLRVSARTISRAIKNNTLRASRFGTRVIIRRKDIDHLFERNGKNDKG